MPLPVLLAPLVGMLAKEGLGLVASAIKGGGQKAAEFIEEKTGIPMSEQTAESGLSPEQIESLRQFQAEHALRLRELELEEVKELNRHEEVKREQIKTDRLSAREMYSRNSTVQETLAAKIYRDSLWIIGIATVAILAVVISTEIWGWPAAIVATVSAVLGSVIKGAQSEREQIGGFFYGGSLKEPKGED
jgi:preprotein translocase subunit SecF